MWGVVWGFSARTNQAGLGLGVDGHGALKVVSAAHKLALAAHHMVS